MSTAKKQKIETSIYDENKNISDFTIFSKNKTPFYVSRLIMVRASPWFKTYCKDTKSCEIEMEAEYSDSDIHNWLLAFHPTITHTPTNYLSSYDRVDKFMLLCLKYEMDDLLAIAKSNIRYGHGDRIEMDDNFVMTIINVKPFNDLFSVVIKKIKNGKLPDSIVDKLPSRLMYEYIVESEENFGKTIQLLRDNQRA